MPHALTACVDHVMGQPPRPETQVVVDELRLMNDAGQRIAASHFHLGDPAQSQESEALQEEADQPIIFQVRGQRHNRRPSERNYSGRVHLPDDGLACRRHVRGGSPEG